MMNAKKVFCHFLNRKKTLFLVLLIFFMFSPVVKVHFGLKNQLLTPKKQYVEYENDRELRLIYE